MLDADPAGVAAGGGAAGHGGQLEPVVPPPTTESFKGGDHAYRCVGGVIGKSGDGKYFQAVGY